MYVGVQYPGLYWWQLPVPVEPGFKPCFASTVTVRVLVIAAIDCQELVTADLTVKRMTIPVTPIQVPVTANGLRVRLKVETSEQGITVQDLTPIEPPETPPRVVIVDDLTVRPKVVADEVTVLFPPTIPTEGPDVVVAEIKVEQAVTSDGMHQCCLEAVCESS